MKLIRLTIIGLSIGLLFSSCGAKKKVKTQDSSNRTISSTERNIEKPTTEKTIPKIQEATKTVVSTKELSTQNYINNFSETAISQMRSHKIPASITLAQGILESNSGNSILTRGSNNHFGIKCHKGWYGEKTYHDDDEKAECFRVYPNSASSYDDHSRFLTERKRYAKLFKLKQGDYKEWAKGLRKAGYATDKRYPQKLIRIIEKYELYKYDEIVLGNNASSDPNVYIVKKGEGLYGIARRNKIKLVDLMSINNLSTTDIFPGQRLFLKPIKKPIIKTESIVVVDTIPVEEKETKVIEVKEPVIVENRIQETKIQAPVQESIPEPIQETIQDTPAYHIVEAGETLYHIAYKYKLAVPDLRRWNGIRKNEISIGQKVFIKEPNSVDSSVINSNRHKVIPEDTLYRIAKKYQTSVPELMRLNNMTNHTIYIGQVLVIR